MARVTATLPYPLQSESATGLVWNANNIANVTALASPANAPRYVQQFQITRINISNEYMRLFVNDNDQGTGTIVGTGQELNATWEQFAQAIVLSAPTLSDLVIPGPNFSTNTRQDAGEWYQWRPANAKWSEIVQWLASFRALTTENKRQATITFQDEVNLTPTAPDVPDVNAVAGTATRVTLPVGSGGNTPLTYAVSTLPTGWSFDAGTRVLSGSTSIIAGTTTITYTVRDADGDTATDTFDIIVAAADRTPTAPNVPDVNAVAGMAIEVTLPTGSGGDGRLTYAVANLPQGWTFDPRTRELSGSTSIVEGTTEITYTVRDTDGDIATATFDIIVKAPLALTDFNSAGLSMDLLALLSVSGSPATLRVLYQDSNRGGSDTPIAGELGLGTAQTLITQIRWDTTNDVLVLNDNDTTGATDLGTYFGSGGAGRDLTFYFQTKDDGVESFAVADNISSAGGNFLRLSPTDAVETILDQLVTGERFLIGFGRVAPQDLMPTVPTVADINAVAGTARSVTLPEGSGGDGTLRYSVSLLPRGWSFNANTRVLSGTTAIVVGTTEITYTVTDEDGDTDTAIFDIIVAAAPPPDTSPVFTETAAARTAVVGQQFAFARPQATGGNGQLRYSVSPSSGRGLNANANNVQGSPTSTGTVTFTWTVTDEDGDTATFTLTVTINAAPPPDTSPVAPTVADITGTVGDAVDVILPVGSGGNAPLEYGVSALPQGLAFVAGTRRLHGSLMAAGTTEITYTVTDADGDTDTSTFDIVVAAPGAELALPELPAIMGDAGDAIDVTLPEGSGGTAPRTYSVSTLPQGLAFVAATRRLHGALMGVGTPQITYTVTDADGNTAQRQFNIVITSREPSIWKEVAIPIATEPTAVSGIVPTPINVRGDTEGRDESIGLFWQAVIQYDGELIAWVEVGTLDAGTGFFVPLEGRQPDTTQAARGFIDLQGLQPDTVYYARLRFQDPDLDEDEQYSSYVLVGPLQTEQDRIDEILFRTAELSYIFPAGQAQTIVLPKVLRGIEPITYSLIGKDINSGQEQPLQSWLSWNGATRELTSSTRSASGNSQRLEYKATDSNGSSDAVIVEVEARNLATVEDNPPGAFTEVLIQRGDEFLYTIKLFPSGPAVNTRQGRMDFAAIYYRRWRSTGSWRLYSLTNKIYSVFGYPIFTGDAQEYEARLVPWNEAGAGPEFIARSASGGQRTQTTPVQPRFPDKTPISLTIRANQIVDIQMPVSVPPCRAYFLRSFGGRPQQGLSIDNASNPPRLVGSACCPGEVWSGFYVGEHPTNEQTDWIDITITVLEEDPGTPTDFLPNFLPTTFRDRIKVGEYVNIQLPIAIGGDRPLTYALAPAPPDFLEFEADAVVITGRAEQAATYRGTLTVTDADASNPDTDTVAIEIEIDSTDEPLPKDPPLYAAPDDEIVVERGQPVTVTLDDPEGDVEGTELVGAPAWIQMFPDGTIRIMPPADLSPLEVDFILKKFNIQGETEQVIKTRVIDPPPPSRPVFNPDTQDLGTVQRGGTARTGTLRQARGRVTSYAVVALPGDWVQINTNTRRFSLQPPAGQAVGRYDFILRAFGPDGSDDLECFFTVNPSGSAPTTTVPNPVTDLTARAGVPVGSIEADWTASATDGSHDPPTGYKVYTRAGSRAWQLRATTAITNQLITGLLAGRLYDVRVVAYNDAGNSNQRIASSVRAKKAVPPPRFRPPARQNLGRVRQGETIRGALQRAAGSIAAYEVLDSPGAWVDITLSNLAYAITPAADQRQGRYDLRLRAKGEGGVADLAVYFEVIARTTFVDRHPSFAVQGVFEEVEVGQEVDIRLPVAQGGNAPLFHYMSSRNIQLPRGLRRIGHRITGRALFANLQYDDTWKARDADGDVASCPVHIATIARLTGVSNLSAGPHGLFAKQLVVEFDEYTIDNAFFLVEYKLDRSGTSWQRYANAGRTDGLWADNYVAITRLISSVPYRVRVTPVRGNRQGPAVTTTGTPT